MIVALALTAQLGLVADGMGPDLRRVLEDFPSATAHRYGLRDDGGATMDCLKVVPSPKMGYLGIYHTMESGRFVLRVARSSDLLNWRRMVDVDTHAHQGTLHVMGQTVLAAYEKDAPGRGNWIRIQEYTSVDDLFDARPTRTFDVPNTLSHFAEGTPNFMRVSPDREEIELGFHYFRNGEVDRQALGTLTQWRNWIAAPVAWLNEGIEAFGVRGNIGDRDAVDDGRRRWLLLEGKHTPGDWASWRLFLADRTTREVTPVNFRTHRGSRSFANPTATVCLSPSGKRAYVVTVFLPSEGAAEGEAGQLLYYREVEFDAAKFPRP